MDGMTVHKLRDAVVVMAAFLALIWALQVLNWADGYRLDGDFGILPMNLSRLPDIFTAPFLHVSWQHIEGNSLPLFVLGVLAVRKVTTLSLSFDHRIVDGELGSAVLRDVGSMLEDPVRILAWS